MTTETFSFQQSSSPLLNEVYKKLMKSIEQHMPLSVEEALRRVCAEDNVAFAGLETSVNSKKQKVICKIVRLPATAIPASMAMAISKGSPYKRILNR
jgi:hypothetical protein